MKMRRWIAWLAATGMTGAASAETLYNGTALPDPWPPRRTLAELRSGEPMAVPYLKTPPPVIPIDVGRQLFVDDFLVEQTTLTRRFHKCELYAGNPVLWPDRRWEKIFPTHTSMAFSDGVFYDPEAKLFKMWYMSALFGDTSYATSPDGLHWTKPALNVRPPTNIVLLGGQRDSATVWLDLDASDPRQRYKLFQFNRDNWQGSVHTSPDGIHWTKPVWTGVAGDRSTFFYNPFRKVWVFSIRAAMYPGPWNYKVTPPKIVGRCRRYWEARDFVGGSKWPGADKIAELNPGEPPYWTACDRLDSPGIGPNDAPAELYNLDAVGYESLMLGLFSVLHSTQRGPGQPKINDIMLGFSRDGFHWDRPFREAVISVSGKPDTWNYGNVQSVGGGCLIVGDRLYIYASGRNATNETTGVAFLRRDGFASMEAGEQEGTLTTRPVRFGGKHLFVNAATMNGELRVEALDKNGKVIAPFTPENCVPITTDKTLLAVRWKGVDDLAALAGKTVRFRFHLRNGALYAFWVSPDASGASRGYVAAGGPGFTGPTDTVGSTGYAEGKEKP
jgi:hypothetical protein